MDPSSDQAQQSWKHLDLDPNPILELLQKRQPKDPKSDGTWEENKLDQHPN